MKVGEREAAECRLFTLVLFLRAAMQAVLISSTFATNRKLARRLVGANFKT